jgi:hypothetical protein
LADQEIKPSCANELAQKRTGRGSKLSRNNLGESKAMTAAGASRKFLENCLRSPGQKRSCAIIEMLLLPRKSGFLVDFVKTPPNRILTHHLLHPKQWRIDRITSQRRDVRIASMASQHRQKHHAKNVAFAWCIRAREVHRTARNPAVEQTRPASDTR